MSNTANTTPARSRPLQRAQDFLNSLPRPERWLGSIEEIETGYGWMERNPDGSKLDQGPTLMSFGSLVSRADSSAETIPISV
jgi:hypothetical protein